MGHPISLSTPTGRITGWRADPPFPPRGALIVVQEIFGVNAHIRHQVDRYAAHGFTAVAPALFDHIDYGIELGYDEAGIAKGREYAAQLDFEHLIGDIESVMRELAGDTKVGVVGFCWGATLAFLGNTRLEMPCVCYYGARTLPFVRERAKAPMEFHFGENDPLIPPEAIEAHREAHPEAHIHLYPAGHGFNCEDRADYDKESALLALDRTISFFTRTLRV